MKYLILFLSLFFVGSLSAQDVWNHCGTTLTVYPQPAYDSTFVLEAPSREALKKGMANWVPASSGGAASYSVYTALLTQNGTDAPVATVLENTLGGTVVWTRFSAGVYRGTLSNIFTSQTFFPFSPWSNIGVPITVDADNLITMSIQRDAISDDYIQITVNESGTPADGWMQTFFLEVKVYP